MEYRTRFLPKLLNSEAEEYLQNNDVIIVPVGTVEMHGGFPLDSETVISEAIALKMAEKCDGLVLSGLPYFYAGATASGRGTVQVSVRQGIDYLSAIAHSLLRQGFKRQIYVSFHGPAHMTICPMVRDFFDETGVPILYLDATMALFKNGRDLFKGPDDFHAITAASYAILNRLEDVPLTTKFAHAEPQTVARFNELFGLAYQSAAVGYCFGSTKDHMPTPAIPSVEARDALAKRGAELIDSLVALMDMQKIIADMRELEKFEDALGEECPWTPAAYHKNAYNR